jgi:hypothetical protein
MEKIMAYMSRKRKKTSKVKMTGYGDFHYGSNREVKNPEVTTVTLKGKEGKNCNVTHCQMPHAHYEHIHNHAFYCRSCAEDINEFAIRVDKIDLFPSLQEIVIGREES